MHGLVVLPIGRKQAGGVITPLGTCFAVAKNRFVTASHAVGANDQGLMVIVRQSVDLHSYQDVGDMDASGCELKLVNYDPIYDISILAFRDPDSWQDNNLCLGSTDLIRVGEQVDIYGYPHADHGRLVLTLQKGVVGAKVLLGAHGVKAKHIVLNTLARPGQSGGPVFISGSFIICAMITGAYYPYRNRSSVTLGGVDPSTLHQTTHAVSAEYITRML